MPDGLELPVELTRSISETELPRYIAIEGSIGVGKTTLAKHLGHLFNYETLLEQPQDNPFLERFYKDTRTNALPTQLFFLLQRAKQLQELRQCDMFEPVRIADFLIDKDPIFAQIVLDDDELRIYQQVYEQMTIDAPRPDLVIYLQAPTDVLIDRIAARGVAFEQDISEEYLSALNEAYTHYFHYYDQSPLLVVNVADIDLANNTQHLHDLVETMLTIKSGRHYYNPSL